jgi:L-ascorbate metabolism protein UlaG (beta-lactamase superfamily)
MLILGVVILIIIVSVYLFMHGAQFGARPQGESLQKIQASPNYRDGQFQNLSNTPQLTDGASFLKILKKFFFDKSEQRIPPAPLPSIKSDLLNLNKDENILVWFGHSSYFMQIDGRTFLVDPVFSGNASPLRFTTKSFKGSDIYSVSDFPEIDYLIISHDHWDHLDYRTILQLKPKVKRVVTGLGTAAHFISWGYDKNRIEEKDWNEQFIPENGFTLNAVPARHFSGRGFKRNRSIWLSFVLTTPSKKIFIGGDSGYDRHFAEIGNQYGPFDLAILEDGQYNRYWKYIHMNPEETVQAALDLRTEKLLPVHWGKFSLSIHSWDEPIRRIKKEAERRNVKLLHPMIGELVYLDLDQVFSSWWEGIS